MGQYEKIRETLGERGRPGRLGLESPVPTMRAQQVPASHQGAQQRAWPVENSLGAFKLLD